MRDEGLFLCLTRQTGKRYFVDRGGFFAIIFFSLATERITEENKNVGKKLEIKIDKMPAINKSGKIDMRGKENAVEATVTNLSDADRVLKVSCYIHLDNDPDFPDIPYLEVKMAFKDGTEEVKDSWSRRIEQEHASGDVILQEGMVKLRNEKGKLYTPVYKAMKKMSEEIARKEATFAKETDKSRFEALMSDFAKKKRWWSR